MSKKGEIDTLSKIVRPNIAIITNVAEAHIENFKSLNHIAKAKGEIINNISNLGCLILDRDNKFYKYFNSKAKKKKIKVLSVGYNKKSDIKIIKIKNYLNYKVVTIKSFNKNINLELKDN